MHCRDSYLLQLLGADGSTSSPKVDVKSIEAHVENCEKCQARLAHLADHEYLAKGVLSHLRTAVEDDFETHQRSSGISLELSSLMNAEVSVETEPVDLDFLAPPSHPELLGRLGRYDIERVIGKGGMGLVLKAHDSELNRVVAIKVLAPHLAGSSAARRRFAREAQAAAAVLHPNVLPIYNVESEGKLPYFVMQFVAGQSLQSRVDRDGPLEVHVALRIAKQTAAALAVAHSQGLVHRDVKPGNILLEEGVERAQLSDFGLARTADDASLTRTGIVAGTPHYMSPEQANGERIDARSDLFSLGCVLYFMLTARPPFRAESAMGVLNRICHHAHRSVQSINHCVPRELSLLVDRLLAKDPAKRFESAMAAEAAVDKLLSAIQGGRLRLDKSIGRKPKRLRNRIAAAASIAAVLACGYAVSASNWFSGSPTRGYHALPNQSYSSSVNPNSRFSASTQPNIAGNSPSSLHSSTQRLPPRTRTVSQPVTSKPQSASRFLSDTRTASVSPLSSVSTIPSQPVSSDPPTIDPRQILELEDQWKRDARELRDRIIVAQNQLPDTLVFNLMPQSEMNLAAQIALLTERLNKFNHVEESSSYRSE